MMSESRFFWGVAIVLVISLCLTPLVRKFAISKGWYAQQNERTIHQGKIPRIGGVAIFVSFIVGILITSQLDTKLCGVLAGTAIMFTVGFIDDLCDLSARTKLIFQIIAGIVLICFDIQVDVLRMPFGITIDFGIISILFTLLWVVGVTNAINLIDGLDGLAGGMSSVILMIIALTAMLEGKMEIAHLTLLMIASVFGFLVYNAHPASIFMGDCGSLTLGFFISAISLMGFKSATVMTLALPILILFIPILDTVSAILRRTLKHKKFSSADKEHLHHQLMRRFGQTKSVLIMCSMTACFGISAFVYMLDKELGILIMVSIILLLELFVEKTGMISPKYHPILSVLSRLKKLIKPSV